MAKSIMQGDKNYCFVCGRKAVHRHHVLYGKDRQFAEDFGLFCWLCWDCHEGTNGVHGKNGSSLSKALKQIAQRCFETIYGHELWMEKVGKNYL